MKSTWIIVLALVAAVNAAAADDCVLRTRYVSADAKPLSPEVFASITKEMLMPEIFKRLGPATRDVGSGLYVLEWKTNDGRVFHISTPSLCSKPMALIPT